MKKYKFKLQITSVNEKNQENENRFINYNKLPRMRKKLVGMYLTNRISI